MKKPKKKEEFYKLILEILEKNKEAREEFEKNIDSKLNDFELKISGVKKQDNNLPLNNNIIEYKVDIKFAEGFPSIEVAKEKAKEIQIFINNFINKYKVVELSVKPKLCQSK